MLGIIGGSGLEHAMGAFGRSQSHDVDTPFGKPAAPIVTTEVDGMPVALLKRHGEGHVFSPSTVPYRANVFAMKKLGVTRILATGAVGSLREEIAPRTLVVPDQVIDKTFRRAGTFFDDIAVHVELANPFCSTLRNVLAKAGTGPGFPARVHQGGTYVCMEGPQFSTRAESEMHRAWGASLIGMTVMPEARASTSRSDGQKGEASSTWTAMSSKKVPARRKVLSMTWSGTTSVRGAISSRRLPTAPVARMRVTPSFFIAKTFAR